MGRRKEAIMFKKDSELSHRFVLRPAATTRDSFLSLRCEFKLTKKQQGLVCDLSSHLAQRRRVALDSLWEGAERFPSPSALVLGNTVVHIHVLDTLQSRSMSLEYHF